MSITTAQQADALFKASLGVSNPRPANQFFEQPVKAAPVVLPSSIWADESLIPNTAPVLTDQQTSGVVKKWVDLSLTLVSGSSQAYSHANLNNVIPFNYGDGTSYNYTVKGNDNSAIPFGTNDWVLQNNVLVFYAGIAGLSTPPKITFYQYVGTIGIPVSTGGTVTKVVDDRSSAIISNGQLTVTSSQQFKLGTLSLHLNGIGQIVGVTNDYIVTDNGTNGTGITMNSAMPLEPGDHLLLEYELP
jgi:hypothetical protein